jgi:transcriptional regulator with XRE-family HTH domain
MRIDQSMTDDAVLAEFGGRVAAWRLERGFTQQQLAFRIGIGRATLQRLESGASVQLTSLVKLLRALGTLDGLDAVVPESAADRSADADGMGRQPPRRRAPRQHRARADGDGTWEWRDGSWKWAAGNGSGTPLSL